MLLELSTPSLIAEDSHLTGEVNFYSNAQVYGRIEGDILQQSTDTLFIGNSGWIRGSISSQGPVIVAGRIEGSIQSKSKITLLPTAIVQGNIFSPNIQITPGAQFNGDITMHYMMERAKNSKLAA